MKRGVFWIVRIDLRQLFWFRSLLIAVAGLALGIVVIGAARRHWPMKSGLIPSAAIKLTQDARPLREKAKQTGYFREVEAPNRTAIYRDLADLNNHSAAVIIGTAQQNVSTLSRDGRSISLDYSVRVEYAYKGKLHEGNVIIVSLPGGRVKFDDGSTAEVSTPWLKKMQNGKTYALFLTQETSGSFVTTGDAQGIFEIPTTPDVKVVQSHSGVAEDNIRKYNGMDVKSFLRELRQATGKSLKS